MIPTLIFLGVAAAIVFWLIGIYNGLVKLRNEVKNSFSQIDVQLKRRHDLIPNLIETVKGYMKHERETLEKVTQMRQQAVNLEGIENIAEKDHEIACHGLHHACKIHPKTKRPLMTHAEFKQRTLQAKKILEKVSKQDVIGYRAPNAYIGAWMLDI